MKTKLSASEIAALQIPGLPTTKMGVAAMARRENWPFEMRTGLGGVRKVFELPDRLAAGEGTQVLAQATPGEEVPRKAQSNPDNVVGAIGLGSARVDTALLENAMQLLTEWEEERGERLADRRRPAIIALLYSCLQDDPGGRQGIDVVFRAIG